MKKWCWRKQEIGLLLLLCLLICCIKRPAFAIAQQVVLVLDKAVYMDGEQLQLQARLVPPGRAVSWAWECRLPGETKSSVICTADKLTLDLTRMYHGAVLCPVATLADGTVVRGPEKPLVVELYCTGLEISRLPEKTTYQQGEDFDPAGLRILAKMSDGSLQDVTELCSYAPVTLDLNTRQVLAGCQLPGETGAQKYFGCNIPVTVKVPEQPGDSDGTGDVDPDGQDPGNSGGGDATGGESGDTDSGENLPGSGQQKPELPDAQPGQDGPSWSESADRGMILGIGLLVLCFGMVVALWWVLRRERREDSGEPPAP